MRVWVDDGIVLARGVIGARATQRLARPRRLDCPPSPSSPLHRHPASYHLATCDAVDGARERGDARRVSRDPRGVIRDCRRRSTLERARRSTPPRCARARGSDVARASSSRDNFVRPHPPRRRLGVALRVDRVAPTRRAVGTSAPRPSRRRPRPAAAAAASDSSVPTASESTSYRFVVVFLVALALLLCNADRVIMAVAGVPLAAANGWGALAQPRPILVPLGLRPHATPRRRPRGSLGGKAVLGGGILLWSVATMLTPAAAAASLPVARVSRRDGLGEGVALPS